MLSEDERPNLISIFFMVKMNKLDKTICYIVKNIKIKGKTHLKI